MLNVEFVDGLEGSLSLFEKQAEFGLGEGIFSAETWFMDISNYPMGLWTLE